MCLVRTDGSVSCNQKEILRMQTDFYKTLYTSDVYIEFEFENDRVHGVKLTEQEKESTDAPLTLEELTFALKNMRKDKTARCDGLSSRYFSCFWEQLGPPLMGAFKFAWNENCLHRSARRGIKSLIPKKKVGTLHTSTTGGPLLC